MKKILSAVAVAASLFFSADVLATCSNYTTYTEGQTLSAASLNSLQTNYTNCVNGVLDGDTFTGNILLYSGADINVYSDAGTTLKTSIDGATGDVSLNGGADLNIYSDVGTTLKYKVDGATGKIIAGIPKLGDVINGDITLAAGVLSITGQGGVALSATNPLFVTVPSTTAGQSITLPVTAAQTLQDAAHASPQILGRWGTTASIAWAYAMPVYIGIVNKDNTAGNLRFFLTRNPAITTTPASTNNIGIAGTAPATSSQNNIVLFGTGANTGYDSKPCIILGSVQMTIDASAGGSATIGSLTAGSDGFGLFQENVMFRMPLNQNGAAAGTYLMDNGGTAPIFTSNKYYYVMMKNGLCNVFVSLQGDGGTDGAGAVTVMMVLPYIYNNYALVNASNLVRLRIPGSSLLIAEAGPAGIVSYMTFINLTSGSTYLNSDFSSGEREILMNIIFKAF